MKKHRIISEIMVGSAHSMVFVEYKAKWWHRWRKYDEVFRWYEDAVIFTNKLEICQ